ncbi:MAG: glycosyltransferase family 39 protein [Terracidiphilus sp.]
MSIESKGSAVNRCSENEWWTARLAGPLIAAAIVRLTLLVVTLARSGASALISPDTASYLESGRNLLLHGRFVADGAPDVLRTPGYAFFLAVTSLAGLPAAALVNVILSVFSIVLVWRLGRAVFDDGRIALGAAWIFAFEPLSIVNSALLISETLFLALFLLSLERLVAFLRERNLRVLAEGGLWLAAATFVRPVTYYLPIALAVGLFAMFAREQAIRWKAPGVLLLSVLPLLASWQIRNWAETGYTGFSSVSDLNLYYFIAPEVAAQVDHRKYIDKRSELGYDCALGCGERLYLYPRYLAFHPEQTEWSQGQRLAFMHSEALGVIRPHSGIYLRLCFSHLLVALFGPGTGSLRHLVSPEDFAQMSHVLAYSDPVHAEIALAKTYPWIAAEKAVFVAALFGLYLFAARGILRGGMDRSCLWLLSGTAIYFFVISAAAGGAGVSARYRLPVMPIVCVLAAAGFVRSVKTAQLLRRLATASARAGTVRDDFVRRLQLTAGSHSNR